MKKMDNEFYQLADAHIDLSNAQISEQVGKGKVSASFMYSVARFNAWISACGWGSSKELAEAKEDAIEYFIGEYRKMLEESLDDYIENFDKYMKLPE